MGSLLMVSKMSILSGYGSQWYMGFFPAFCNCRKIVSVKILIGLPWVTWPILSQSCGQVFGILWFFRPGSHVPKMEQCKNELPHLNYIESHAIKKEIFIAVRKGRQKLCIRCNLCMFWGKHWFLFFNQIVSVSRLDKDTEDHLYSEKATWV